ncbi:hypothetical protein TOPH_04321 [Tolypocladium ophioglossoides CBS 100239]|uniref:Uncharacterized protein n=1 Tax=Tolypocladium ophioglossoides (strain CBS 100239) TaxID=1163406 RepID=A0A0L0NA84_TOLOC|nr:hypothetical protein TOPH_04321 [Tolypocladium ophioglossoides CBS 100239]
MRRHDSSSSCNSKNTTSPTSSKPQRQRPPSILPFATARGERRTTTRPPFISIPPPPSPSTPRPSLSRPNSSLPAGSTRSPLRPRDHNQQNVPFLTATTRSTIASAARMPVGDRPRQPQLSAAAASYINRTPLTPKVATKGPPSTATTPLAKRPQSAHAPRDDVSTPVASFLSTNNITPRSGTRQTRVNSVNSTPNGTPNPERTSDGWDNGSRAGLGISGSGSDGSRQAGDSPGETSDSNKFFYASEAKPMQQAAALQRPASVPQKPVTFFYANDISAEAKRTLSPPVNATFAPVLAPTQEPVAAKFFYANGTPVLGPPRPTLPTSGPASIVSTTSRMAPARPTGSSATGLAASAIQRPASPIKAASTPIGQTLRTSPMPPISPNQPPSILSPPTLAPTTSSAGKRRVSIDAAPKIMNRGHARTGSVPLTEALAVPKFAMSPTPSESTSLPLSPGASQRAMTMASILQAAEELREQDEDDDGDAPSGVQSPTKSSHAADTVSELVANARRERKVQDLEITNASLEAINRTLERQLRKQTAELRRYRRLSRSGRISLASAASSRVPSAALTDPPVDLSDLTEEEATEGEDEELDSIDDSDMSSNDSMSAGKPLSPSEKLTARRKRDERRLQLDLTKHQELLVDSQKMNQSLKRCLDWTQVLIKEGQKALEYHVRVSDIEIGGRVLAPTDEEDEDNVSFVQDATIRTDELGPEPPWTKGPQDRDSGIELPVDGG